MTYRFNLYNSDFTFNNLRDIKFIYDEKDNSSQNKTLTVYEKRHAHAEPKFICMIDGNNAGLALSNLLNRDNKDMLPILTNEGFYPQFIIEFVTEYKQEVYELFVGDMDDEKNQLHIIYTNKKYLLQEYNEIYKNINHVHAYMITHRMTGNISTGMEYTPLKGL
jgi:hypothetical protein